jgi:hypothetical protein
MTHHHARPAKNLSVNNEAISRFCCLSIPLLNKGGPRSNVSGKGAGKAVFTRFYGLFDHSSDPNFTEQAVFVRGDIYGPRAT